MAVRMQKKKADPICAQCGFPESKCPCWDKYAQPLLRAFFDDFCDSISDDNWEERKSYQEKAYKEWEEIRFNYIDS